MIWSASAMVERRWATTSVVRPRAGVFERGLHFGFGGAVERVSGFVEDEDGGVFQHDAGDADALLFAAAEFQAAFADARVPALRQAFDEVQQLRAARGFVEFGLGGFGFAVGDVVADRVVEEDDVLRHQAERAAQAELASRRGDSGRRSARAPDAGIVEAEEQLQHRGLAGAGGADDGGGLAGGRGEADAFQADVPALVREADTSSNTTSPPRGLQRDGVRRIGDVRRFIEQRRTSSPCRSRSV